MSLAWFSSTLACANVVDILPWPSLSYLFLIYRVANNAAGRATTVPTVQMRTIPTHRVLWDFLGARGVMMALCLSTVRASRVNTLTLTVKAEVKELMLQYMEPNIQFLKHKIAT